MPYTAIPPNADALTLARQVYLKHLADPSGSALGDVANSFELDDAQKAEEGQYLKALQSAQAASLQGNHDDNLADVAKSAYAATPEMVHRGVGSAISPGDNPYFNVTNRGQVQQADAVNLDETAQEAFAKRAEGTAKLADSGIMPGLDYLRKSLTGPLDTQVPEVDTNHVTPEVAVKQQEAAAAQTSADAHMLSAQKGHGAGDGVSISVQPNPYGLPDAPTFRGKNEAALQKAINDWNISHGKGGVVNYDHNTPQRKPGDPVRLSTGRTGTIAPDGHTIIWDKH